MRAGRSPRRAGLLALVLGSAGLVACTSGSEDDGPAPLQGDYVVDDPTGDVDEVLGGPLPPDGVADITRFVVDRRGDTVVIAVQLARLPEPTEDLRQSLFLTGDDPERPRAVSFSTSRQRLKPVRVEVAVRDDVQETITNPCRGGARASWSAERGVVAIAVPVSCLPRGGLELVDPEITFGAKGADFDDFDGADGVDLPSRLVLPPP